MSAPSAALWVVLIGAMAFGLFQIKLAVQPAEREFARLSRELLASEAGDAMRELAAALTSDLATYFDAVAWLEVSTAGDPAPGSYVLEAALRSRGERPVHLACAPGRALRAGRAGLHEQVGDARRGRAGGRCVLWRYILRVRRCCGSRFYD